MIEMKKCHRELVKNFAELLDQWDKGELFIDPMKNPYIAILDKSREANIPFESKLPIPTDVKTIQLKHVIKAKEADDKSRKKKIFIDIKKELDKCRNKQSMNMYNKIYSDYIDGLQEAKRIVERYL